MGTEAWRDFELRAPTSEHATLRASVSAFATHEVEPRAAACDREERFDRELFGTPCARSSNILQPPGTAEILYLERRAGAK